MGDIAEGSLNNNYQYQGDYSEFDENLGWNDFELRNYDPQIGCWIQQDPYEQYPSPYVGMGNDPVNNEDPDGGQTLPYYPSLLKAVGGSLTGTVSNVSRTVTTIANVASGGSRVLSAISIGVQVANIAANILATPQVGGYSQLANENTFKINNSNESQQQDPPLKTLKELTGKYLYEMSDEEQEMLNTKEGRFFLLGAGNGYRLTFWERLYLAGLYAGVASPSGRVSRVKKVVEVLKNTPEEIQMIKLVTKEVNITARIAKSGMTTGEAGKFFGWLSGRNTKTVKDFTKDLLIKKGWTKEILLDVAQAYETIGKVDKLNPSALLRSQQLKLLVKKFFK